MTGKRKVTSPGRPGRKCAKTATTDGQPAGSSTEETTKLPDHCDQDLVLEEQRKRVVASKHKAVKKLMGNGPDLTKLLSMRFEGKKVEVNDFINFPSKVWFVSEACDTETKEYFINQEIDVDDVIPKEYRTKWTTEVSPAKKKLLHHIKGVMEIYGSSLKYQDKTWVYNEDAGSEHAEEDNTDTVNQSGDDAKVQENRSEKVGGGDFCPKEITELELEEKVYHIYTEMESYDMVVRLVIALMNRMMNSKGREFIRFFLNLASNICFGISNHIQIMPVGSSTYMPEGLAVRQRAGGHSRRHSNASSASGSPAPCHQSPISPPQDRMIFSTFLPQNITSPSLPIVPGYQAVHVNESPVAAKRNRRASTSSKGSFRESDGYIYPDCVVACIDEAKFSKYIFVCEIKSSHGIMKEREYAQLVREMLGACIEQTEVFGIIINCSYARIVRMIVFEESSRIHFGERTYPLAAFESLNSQLLYKFLCDVIAVLDYGNKHIGPRRAQSHNLK